MHINLRYNKFDSMELDFGDKLSLTDLDLSAKPGVGSPMTDLTIHLNCTYVKNLDVSHNSGLQRLTVTCHSASTQNVHLYAHDTSLGFGSGPALEIDPLLRTHVLSLDNNLYFNLEELVSLAPALKQLSLEENSYRKLDKSLTNLTDLHTLSLKHSGANAVDVSIINKLKNLRALNLADNGLTKIDIASFELLEFLAELDLSGNLLTFLSVEDLSDVFPSLEYLDITGNRFSSETLERIVASLEATGIVVNF